ncbi:glycoside hydrolase family 65 protein [Miltoncostaea marina]|uniref:glycoside hydrolase family 65 protein n=1 Tax=Miltoncostaea marina TaxID=2843215 RepID=UPI001C3D30BC|nr:glycosyl hydrolase family 65 protein [Miltoncostaea marina]
MPATLETEGVPLDPWVIREPALDLDRLAFTESVFALSNGHLGLRGNLDEGEPRAIAGTYLNGFYETHTLGYGERAYGNPEDGQTVVNVTDGKLIRLLVEDEPLDVHRGDLQSHERWLDLRTGILERVLVWSTRAGRTVRVTSRRLVSLRMRSVAAVSFEVEAIDRPVRIALQSSLLANRVDVGSGTDPREAAAIGAVLVPRLSVHDGLRVVLAHTTSRTGLSLAAGMEHALETDNPPLTRTESEPDLGRVTVSAQLHPGRPLRMTKLIAYHWSSHQSVEWLRDQVDASLQNALAEGFDGLAAMQREALDAYWRSTKIEVDGDDELQQALRFAQFQLVQAGTRADGRGVPAKGLTGPGYDGHAFWDMEAYVLPVYVFSQPRLARDALVWRHGMLDLARERARQLDLDGAAFPWRTIGGEECSGYWPAGTAAFHVNAGIARAVQLYDDVTGDEDFMRDVGLELLVETARLWASLGYQVAGGAFRIDGVTGPDEYSAIADNNVYTNLMARDNFRAAAAAVERRPERADALGVSPDEVAAWRRAADTMAIPYDERLGVHPQSEGFTDHEVWDFEATAPERYPLLLHHHYLDLYRKQVVKQADLVMAMFTCGDAFTPEQKRRNFEYYEALTVRDSSLSACIQAIVAAEVGHVDLAYDYLAEAALTDLHDLKGNIREGLHMASLAGALLAVVAGFGGLRRSRHGLAFSPRLPRQVERLAFPLLVRDRRLYVEIVRDRATYRLDPGDDPLPILHWGERLTLTGTEAVTRPLPPLPDLPRPRQPAGREPRRRTGGGVTR